ncbi:MAG TPA: acetyl-CoA carboxylase biotin carboxylase subunit [Dehalococcoidia bacterium]|nr:acetyl-CoA carboxylase biotin carboxylase subunit [Dehalococcoidia bacterium]
MSEKSKVQLPFDKILIANRGEIAVRVIRACRDLGIETVAIFSEADRLAPHVRLADEAYLVGGPQPRESYLVIPNILEAARRSGAQAIHPGYGFLSENTDYARACRDAGVVFIGPSPESIEAMGEKTAARRLMSEAGVPVVPGELTPIPDAETMARRAREIGFPVMVKAAGGGGGKGMRVVETAEEIAGAFRSASSEAVSSFGNGDLYLEKLVRPARHIEVQILADNHGHVLHLGERECSIQRRHQKVIEECPSPIVDAELRERLGQAGVAAARAVNYSGAGTIEFLMGPDKEFYFLEMNTRLQVEHPITEQVTGIDLVRQQILIAAGEPLAIRQEDVRWTGHAIECRVTAEDPMNNFLPSIGRIEALQEPSGPGVRVDSGIRAGGEISLYYDPMIAKLIVWGETRQVAIDRMLRALTEYVIQGPITNIPFHRLILDTEPFRAGNLSTDFIAEHWSPDALETERDRLRLAAAVLGALVADRRKREGIARVPASDGTADASRWRTLSRRAGLGL